MGKDYLATRPKQSQQLVHYGIKRRSGRYPWGSGEDPYQHESWYDQLLDDIKKKEKKGLEGKALADAYELSQRDFRSQKTLALYYKRLATRDAAQEMYDSGMGFSEIARKLGMKNESSVRTLLKNGISKNEAALAATVDVLENRLKEVKYLDIGAGSASTLGVTDTRFEAAVQDLFNRGYEIADIYIEQANNKGQGTTVRLLCPPGTEIQEIYKNLDGIGTIKERFVDPSGTTLYGLKPIKSIDSSKVEIRYAEDGGVDRDGVIEIRRGAEGLDLGNSTYAQVRIGVDGTHYLKGMAYYVDDLPKGIDIRFNTNKSKDVSKMDVLKKMEDDPDNPFGAQIKPGGQKGYLNIVNEEGDWGNWSKSLASQMLSKQSVSLASNQLKQAGFDRQREFDEIMRYNNPTVRQYLLQQFADKCDTAAVDLKAAAMPGQASYVLLPIPSLKDNEVYAPNFKQGEKLIMIRYPHGGTFEIPNVTVNNKNADGRKILGTNSPDAIGISPKTAAQLSGADFDGDTVIAFSDRKKQIKTSDMLAGLRNFDPKTDYPKTDKTRVIDDDGHTIQKSVQQREMGVVSNLICDMTIKHNELVRQARLQNKKDPENVDPDFDKDVERAVKYSMVVIDAYKHKLDYKAAEKALNVKELKKKYQAHTDDDKFGGATTLISKASAEQRVPEKRLNYRPDPVTGELGYHDTGRTKRGKDGEMHPVMSKIPAMRLTSDANTLSSGTKMEQVYAEYANDMKALANRARREAIHTTLISPSPQAKKTYSKEVAELNEALRKARSHAPVERAAQIIAKSVLDDKRQKAGRKLTAKEQSKIRSQALAKARADLGGARPKVDITPRQWEAIQKGAVSKDKLTQLLRFASPEQIKEYALPRQQRGMTPTQISLIKSWASSGYTNGEIAEMLGVSTGTVSKYLNA